ncbi:hypothetical protein OGAPHI_002310 [Ogataea philodendri]|uniref:Protein SIP3 n=1 Tax=Ogataea philodendri TaxID=1378263 RepID=A0A9P8T823_9ASCO|nr:uncharacterized protein OGAPHI_002310 [Ogataea philodendri]KAH3668556.1 hypothetical protein OGAPHI_002310 [Ogataea philodendri]
METPPNLESNTNLLLSPPIDTISNQSGERIVKLIAVGLKEASTDSPSFRASANYMNDRIVEYQSVLKKTIAFLKRYSSACSVLDGMSSELVSTFESLDHSSYLVKDVAKPCVSNTSKGMNVILNTFHSILGPKLDSANTLSTLLEKDFGAYFETRFAFETIQGKYDAYLERFVAQPKSLDPTSAKEDALQLFEIRKQYIHVCLSLWICLIDLRHKISSSLVGVSNNVWNASDQTRILSESLGLKQNYAAVVKAKHCLDVQIRSYKLLMKDLLVAKASSEEAVISLYTPSSDLNSYIPATINMSHLAETNVQQYEKHGWVFMKSNRLNSKDTVWIKRWLFVKSGLFGFLSLNSSLTAVEESDKIGILLANVRYKPEETRKFCFEIKTLETEITLQVETLGELKSWISVFHNVKASALKTNNAVSMSRFEPLLDQFRLKPVVEKDLELVNFPTSKSDNAQNLLTHTLPQLKLDLDFSPPLVTELTNLSCLSHLYLTSAEVPSAFTANVWGFINWGLYYTIDSPSLQKVSKVNELNSQNLTYINLRYPAFYPLELRRLDLQLRSLFESRVQPDEFVLVVFRAFWSANSKQELFCHIYVTQKHVYLYTSNCGLVSISIFNLVNFLYVDSVSKDNYDVLRMYTVSGISTKMKLFFESGSLIKDQINYLISARKSSETKSLETILENLTKIKTVRNQNHEDTSHGHSSGPSNKNDEENSVLTVASASDLDNNNKLNYSDDMKLLWIKKYDIPAKALFHVLVGDQSFLLHSMLPFAQITVDTGTQHTIWRCDSKQKLTRNIWSSNLEALSVQQEIESMSNNKYYNISQSTSYLRFPFGSARRLVIRFVIFNTDSRTCKLLVYYKVVKTKSFAEVLSSLFFRQVMLFKIDDLHKHITSAINSLSNENRKIASAIRLFGPVTKFDSDEPTKEELEFQKEVRGVKAELLLNVVLQKLNLELDKLIYVTAKLVLQSILTLFKDLQMYWILVVTLAVSLIFNLYFSGKTSYSYWMEYNTEKYVDSLTQRPVLMKRMISLSDIQEFTQRPQLLGSGNETASGCLLEFQKQMEVHDHPTSNTGRVQSRLVEFGLKRNELLTELGLLNAAEKTYITSEWKKWVFNEHKNCELARIKYPDSYDEQLARYCDSTRLEMNYISNNLL